MAIIILNPNEVFEHSHREESYTTLIEGKALYSDSHISMELELGRPVITLANVQHTLHNIGSVDCKIECGHGTRGRVEK